LAPLECSNNDYLGINPGGILGAAGLLVDHSLPGVASCQVLHHHHGDDVSIVGYPFNKASVLTGQCPSHRHWRAEFYTYVLMFIRTSNKQSTWCSRRIFVPSKEVK